MGYRNLKTLKHSIWQRIKGEPIHKIQTELDAFYKKNFEVDEEGDKLIKELRIEHDQKIDDIKKKANKDFEEINLEYARRELGAIRKHIIKEKIA